MQMAHVAERSRIAAGILLLAAALFACESSEKGPASAPPQDGGVCVDRDGDGFGDGCTRGRDCDDAKAEITNQCLSCLEPDQGCACETGAEPVACFLDPSDLPDGRLMCHEGTRHCRDGAWSACESIHSYVMERPAATHLVPDAGHPNCTPCDVLCYRVDDNLDPVDGGLTDANSTGVSWIPGGGLSNTSFLIDAGGGSTFDAAIDTDAAVPPCQLNVPPDTDCDGLDDDVDPYPATPPFATDYDTIYHELAAGQTGTSSLDLRFNLNNADIYFLIDQSGSMDGERDRLITDLRSGTFLDPTVNCVDTDYDGMPNNELKAGGIIGSIRCLIRDAWFGAGYFVEYALAPNGEAYADGRSDDETVYRNVQNMTASITDVNNALGTMFTNGNIDTPESDIPALYAMATGQGMYLGHNRQGLPPQTACPPDTFGYPCFRNTAIPIVILITDASFHNGPAPTPNAYQASYNILGGTSNTITPVPNGNEDFSTAYDIGDITDRLLTFGGDTMNAVGNIPGNLMGCGAASATRDVVFRFNITAPRVITIKTDGTVQDTLISLFSALPETAPSSSTPVTGESHNVGDVYDRWIELTGSTSGLAANYQGGVLGCNAGSAGRDMLFSFTPSQNMSLTATSGMSDRIGWWRMGDGDVFPDIVDVTGEHDGSMKSMTAANFVADAPSGGTSVSNTISTSFSGSNQRVEVSNDFELDVSDALTVSVWLKGAVQDNTIVSKFETSGNRRSWRIATTTAGKARINVSATGGPYDSSNVKEWNTSYTVLDGNWHHVAFTYLAGSPDGVLKVYVDGVEDTNVTRSYNPNVPSLYSTSAPVTIGGYYSNSDLFVGNIDEVAIWHAALTAPEIAVIYNNGQAQDLARVGGTTVALYSALPPSNPVASAIANNNDGTGTAYNVANDLTGVYQAFSGDTSAPGITASMTAATVGCGSVDGSNDAVYRFRMASDRRVRIDTEGSSFDTVIALHSNTPAGLTARTSTNSNDNAGSVEAIGDMTNAGYAYTGTSAGLSPDYDGASIACGAANGSNDAVYSFTLPSTRNIHIDTSETVAFDSVVALHSGLPAPVTTVSDNTNETLGSEGTLGTINGARKQLTGNTSAMAANYSSAIVGCGASSGARDAVVDFTLTSPATVEIDSQGSSFDTVLGLFNETYPVNNLVAWWRLGDGDTYPSVTGVINGFVGTMNNMAANDFEHVTPPQDCPNTLSTNFDGSNDQITIADNNTLDFTTSMTASVWVKGVGQDRTIFSKYTTTGNQRSWRIYGTTTGGVAVAVSRDGTYSATTSKSYATTGVTPLNNEWHHVAFTFGEGALKVYVDGVESAVSATYDAAMTTIFSGTSPLSIGSHFDSAATSFFAGNIDEPVLWNSALTATQIASIYNAGKPMDPRYLDVFPSTRPAAVDVASTSTSLDFDGSNDTVLVANDATINIADNLTVSLWANVSTSGARTLASRYRTSPTNLRAWRMVSDSGRLRVYLSPNGSLSSPNYKDYSTVATVFGTGTWTHVAFTFASGTLKLYVNGVEATGAALTKTVDGTVASLYAPVTAAATRVGGYENNATGGVTEVPSGRIDELSIWNTTVLTPAQITALYNSGVPTDLKGSTNLVLWWRMGELDSYATISDRVSTRHGTMTNMASNDFVAGVPGATFYENETKASAYDVGTINGRWRTFAGSTATMIADTGGFGCGSGAGERDAFFKFTLSSPTSLDIDTIGSAFDTSIGVFPATATLFNAGEIIACDNDSGGSTTSSLNTGTLAAGTYYVVIKGSGGASGAYQLSIKDTTGAAIANDILGSRITCSNDDGTETTSRITQTLPAGTYHVVVKSTGGSGAYNLRISEQGVANTQIACARASSAGSTTPPDAGCTFQSYGGHGYWFCTGARSWTTARTLCQAIGYDLIAIDDAAEQAFANTHRSGETHIGMNDIAVEGIYGWINGSTSTYTAWGSGQPNNNGGVQDCSELYYSDGTWQDNDCSETGHFICESGVLSDTAIEETLPAGTYYVVVKGASATAEGAYKMTIRDIDASTPPLYCNDDGAVDGSSAIEADLLANTDYYVSVKGKSASSKGPYRITFRDVTGVPSNLMACGNQELTTTMLTAGQTYYAAVKGDALVGDGPFSLILQDSDNTGDQMVACDDNYGPGLQSNISQMLNPGSYYLAMKKANHSRGQGNYQISFGGSAGAASTYAPPTWNETLAVLNARRIRVMTVYSTGNDTLATIQQHAESLANATNAVGSGGTPLVSSIAPDGTGLSAALVNQVQELAQYISMNMRLRVSYDPDMPPAPGFLFNFVAIDESPGNGCTNVVGSEHRQCLPGATPRFQVNITNPLGSPVPPNPTDTFGGYNFRIQLIANNQYVVEEVPVYIVPLQTTFVPPNTRYEPVGVYMQDVDGRSCMGNQRPSWRDLLFNTTVPDGGSVTFDACTAEVPGDLTTCSYESVATISGSGTCMTGADCDMGEVCAANGVCLAITGDACTSDNQCADSASCIMNVCMYSGSPVSLLQGIGAENDYRQWLRLRVTMRTNPAATEAPRLDQWQIRYECNDVQ